MIAKMEDKIYMDTNLKSGLEELQNEIIANLIINAKNGKKGFLFKINTNVYDNEKVVGYAPLGYLIGYERKREDANSQKGEKEIYVSDFAVRDSAKNGLKSRLLILSFIERYVEEYKENLPSIIAEFREGTSYNFILNSKRHNHFLQKFGVKISKVDEYDTERKGCDITHKCRLYISKI